MLCAAGVAAMCYSTFPPPKTVTCFSLLPPLSFFLSSFLAVCAATRCAADAPGLQQPGHHDPDTGVSSCEPLPRQAESSGRALLSTTPPRFDGPAPVTSQLSESSGVLPDKGCPVSCHSGSGRARPCAVRVVSW